MSVKYNYLKFYENESKEVSWLRNQSYFASPIALNIMNISNSEGWFRAGRPIPRRKYPPHSLMEYYTDPNHRGYLSDAKAMQESRIRLAEIIGYSLENSDNSNQELEFKRPEQVFLGLEPGEFVTIFDYFCVYFIKSIEVTSYK